MARIMPTPDAYRPWQHCNLNTCSWPRHICQAAAAAAAAGTTVGLVWMVFLMMKAAWIADAVTMILHAPMAIQLT